MDDGHSNGKNLITPTLTQTEIQRYLCISLTLTASSKIFSDSNSSHKDLPSHVGPEIPVETAHTSKNDKKPPKKVEFVQITIVKPYNIGIVKFDPIRLSWEPENRGIVSGPHKGKTGKISRSHLLGLRRYRDMRPFWPISPFWARIDPFLRCGIA